METVLESVRVLLNVNESSAGVKRVVSPVHLILNGTESSVLRSVGLRINSANRNARKNEIGVSGYKR